MKNLLFIGILTISLNSLAQESVHSILLDGTNDFLNFGNIVIPSLPVTIQADVKLPTGYQSNEQFIIFASDDSNGAYSGFWLTVKSTEITATFGDGTAENANARRSKDVPHNMLENIWYNVACVISGPTDMNIYLNGIEMSGAYDGAGGAYMADNGGDAVCGVAATSIGDLFASATIDNLHVWSVALTPTEINTFIQCPPVGNETGIEGYWNFEEASGTIANDLTSNGYDGVLVDGPVWSTDVPANNCPLGLDEYSAQKDKKLVKIVNVLGQETDFKPNTVLIYIYSDGTSERLMKLEE